MLIVIRLLAITLTALAVTVIIAKVWGFVRPSPLLIILLVATEILIVFVYGFSAAKRRYWNILIAIDFLANAYCGGDPAETVSSRAAKQAHKRGWRLLGRILDKIDPGHMGRSIIDDRGDNAAWE